MLIYVKYGFPLMLLSILLASIYVYLRYLFYQGGIRLMLTYQFDPDVIQIQEKTNDKDVEFEIRVVKEEALVHELRQIRKWFETNDVHTDVLFYGYPDRTFKVIVRHDYYVEFVLELMKHRLLRSVEWKE